MSTDPTQFTRESARRIASVVRSAELTPLASQPLNFERVDFSKSKIFRVGTFSGAWPVGTENTVTFRNATTAPNTVTVQNLFFDINFTPSGSPDCAIAKEGSAWYLVSVPLEASAAVSDVVVEQQSVLQTSQTTKLTFFGTASLVQTPFVTGRTTDLTYIAAVIKTTAQATFLTQVQATLNTTNCTIAVTPTTASMPVVTDVYGTESTLNVITDAEYRTSMTVSMDATQTATVLTAYVPKTIDVIQSISTAPVLKFGFH